jgi:hypothetical protein
VLEHDGEPLILGAGHDLALRSWRIDATPGPLSREAAHTASIRALAVLEHDGEPLILSAGDDAALYAWTLNGSVPRPGTATGSRESVPRLNRGPSLPFGPTFAA